MSFRMSNLRRANFSQCYFDPDWQVDFSGADLSGTDFRGCEGLISGGVKFKEVVLDEAKFDDGVKQLLLAKLQSRDE